MSDHRERADDFVISSRDNPRLRFARSLLTRKGRRKADRTLLVGAKLIREAVAEGLALDAVFLRQGSVIEALGLPDGVPLCRVAPSLFAELTPFDSPPDLVAIAATRERSIADLAGSGQDRAAIVVACGIQDPGNLGTILRSAWFFGFRGLAATPTTTDPWAPKVLRAAIGALLRAPPAAIEGGAAAFAAVSAHGFTPIILDAHGGQPLGRLVWPRRAAIFIGAEGQGFAALPEVSALRVTIEGRGAESLNVAAAFAVAAYEWSQQHRDPAPPEGRPRISSP